MSKGVSVPIKLLHEGEGHPVTVELKTGEIYRGLLNESEERYIKPPSHSQEADEKTDTPTRQHEPADERCHVNGT